MRDGGAIGQAGSEWPSAPTSKMTVAAPHEMMSGAANSCGPAIIKCG